MRISTTPPGLLHRLCLKPLLPCVLADLVSGLAIAQTRSFQSFDIPGAQFRTPNGINAAGPVVGTYENPDPPFTDG